MSVTAFIVLVNEVYFLQLPQNLHRSDYMLWEIKLRTYIILRALWPLVSPSRAYTRGHFHIKGLYEHALNSVYSQSYSYSKLKNVLHITSRWLSTFWETYFLHLWGEECQDQDARHLYKDCTQNARDFTVTLGSKGRGMTTKCIYAI